MKRLIPILLLLCVCTFGTAQTPKNVRIIDNPHATNPASYRMDCSVHSAGTIDFDIAGFTGFSNDVDMETKYLCFGDELDLIHNGDFNLDGDPQMATDPGIGYIFYFDAPTIAGDNLQLIQDDVSLFDQPEFVVPGGTNIPLGLTGLWTAAGSANGDITLKNEGLLQTGFNNGMPIDMWFAPATFDDFIENGSPGYELDDQGVLGACVKVSIDEAFRIVYLNEIEATLRTISTLEGSFKVQGGSSEFDNSTYSNISVRMTGNPSIVGTITSGGAPSHGDIITFSVPQAGDYTITIEDEKGCPFTFEMSITDEPPYTFILPDDLSADVGSILCVAVSSENFTNVVSFQYAIGYDPNVLSFIDDSETLLNLGFFLTADLPGNGDPFVGITWQDATYSSTGITVPDNEPLFEICFDVIGAGVECTSLEFTNLGGSVQFGQPELVNSDGEVYNDELIFQDGKVVINSNDLNPIINGIVADCPSTGGGSGNGGFSISIQNGMPPYSVSWQPCDGGPLSGPFQINNNNINTYTGLAGDDYCITITDATVPSLFAYDTVSIPLGPDLGASIITTVPISCNGGDDGEVEVQLTDNGVIISNPSTTDYSYEWTLNGTVVGTSSPTLSNIPSGMVGITVTHNETGCDASASLTLSQPAGIELDDVNIVNPNCPGEPGGSISITMSGGTPPYTYTWDSPNGTNNSTLPALTAGTYCVTVEDNAIMDCPPFMQCFDVVDPAGIQVVFSNDDPVSCFNGVPCDGRITATATGGGVGSYTFNWASGESDNGVTSSSATQLCQGMQILNVSDGVCGLDTIFMISAPDSLEIDQSLTRSYPTSCFGTDDGRAKVTALGGNPAYTYRWNVNGTVITADSISDLASGTYTVLIEDSKGCTLPFSIEVGEPDSLVAFIDPNPDNTTNFVSCNGEADGTIAVAWSGGNAGQATYNWDPAVNTDPTQSTVTGLSAGTYVVTVTDMNGCADTTSHTIMEPPVLTADIPTPARPACFGGTTLVQVESVVGGCGGPYTYSINNGISGAISESRELFAGTYLISVFDACQCVYEEEIFIDNPQEIMVDIGDEEEINLGDSFTFDAFVSGPNLIPADSLIWTPAVTCADSSSVGCLDPTVAPLQTTTYTLTVIDELGCTGSDNVIIKVDADRNVYIPNVFSPDADGVNDNFTPIIGPGVSNVKYMRVFDRWGELLYQEEDFLPFDDFSAGWDGTFRGKTVSTGVYVYLIEVEFLDGVTLLYRGDVLAIY